MREKIINNMKSINLAIKFGTVIDPFVEMSDRITIGESSIIYTDLIREFVKNGHRVYAISPN